MSDDPSVAVLEAAPERLADGSLVIPLNAFSMEQNLPSQGDLVIASWPTGLARGRMLASHITLMPEVEAQAAAHSQELRA